VHHRVGAVERRDARVGVTNVRAYDARSEPVEPGCQVFLAVQEHVQHIHVVPGRAQSLDDKHADVPRAACDEHLHQGDSCGT
jgi:hypothetical protein